MPASRVPYRRPRLISTFPQAAGKQQDPLCCQRPAPSAASLFLWCSWERRPRQTPGGPGGWASGHPGRFTQPLIGGMRLLLPTQPHTRLSDAVATGHSVGMGQAFRCWREPDLTPVAHSARRHLSVRRKFETRVLSGHVSVCGGESSRSGVPRSLGRRWLLLDTEPEG